MIAAGSDYLFKAPIELCAVWSAADHVFCLVRSSKASSVSASPAWQGVRTARIASSFPGRR